MYPVLGNSQISCLMIACLAKLSPFNVCKCCRQVKQLCDNQCCRQVKQLCDNQCCRQVKQLCDNQCGRQVKLLCDNQCGQQVKLLCDNQCGQQVKLLCNVFCTQCIEILACLAKLAPFNICKCSRQVKLLCDIQNQFKGASRCWLKRHTPCISDYMLCKKFFLRLKYFF